MHIWKLCFLFTIVSLYWAVTSQQQENHNATQQPELHNVTVWTRSREKRHLIFSNLGVHKFIVSIALPVPLYDKRTWRTLFGAWNFQWQHLLPTTALKWWNSTYHPSKARSFEGAILPTAPLDESVDLTGTFLYALVEEYMNNKGVNGKECMMRSICENAQVNLVGGVLDRVYRRLLTPERAMEQYYKDAFAVGEKGADCVKTYPRCPRGTSVFDNFVSISESN